jgi:hypothetical protein
MCCCVHWITSDYNIEKTQSAAWRDDACTVLLLWKVAGSGQGS